MRLVDFGLAHLRLFEVIRLEFGAGINLFQGENASGKTSLLEAIYFLSLAKSFRTPRSAELIRHGASRFMVTASLKEAGGVIPLGVEKDRSRVCIKANNEPVATASEQAWRLPVLAWLPDSAKLFTGLPKLRRHWLDWSLFHVKRDSLATWKAYHRVLRHRNAALRDVGKTASELLAWETAMCKEAGSVDRLRGEYLKSLGEQLADDAEILPGPGARIDYWRGWTEGSPLRDSLLEQRPSDQHRGYTACGPHRAEVVFSAGDQPVASLLSRGQMKLYGVALLLAQIRCMVEQTSRVPLVLMDDVDAELDVTAQRQLFAALQRAEAQCFVTTLNPALSALLGDDRSRVFHVKQGTVELVQ